MPRRLQLTDKSFVCVSRCDYAYLRSYRRWTRWGTATPYSRAAGGYMTRVIAQRMGLRVPAGWYLVLRDRNPRNLTRGNLLVVRRPSDRPRDRRKGVTCWRGRWRAHGMANRTHALARQFKTRREAKAVRAAWLRKGF